MGIMVSDRKLKAATSSMHQFCPTIRTLFDHHVSDVTVEAMTIFLYVRLAKEVFSPRFAQNLGTLLPDRLKYLPRDEAAEHVSRIATDCDAYEQSEDDLLPEGATQTEEVHRIRSITRTLLLHGGMPADDGELVRMKFETVENVLKRIRSHLMGIKKQNPFLM